MKYREKLYYSKVPPLGMVENNIMVSPDEGSCFICKEFTNFVEINFECYLCSEECSEKLWQQYCTDCAGCPEYCQQEETTNTLCSKCMKTTTKIQSEELQETSSGVFMKVSIETCQECGDVVMRDWYFLNGLEKPSEEKVEQNN